MKRLHAHYKGVGDLYPVQCNKADKTIAPVFVHRLLIQGNQGNNE